MVDLVDWMLGEEIFADFSMVLIVLNINEPQ